MAERHATLREAFARLPLPSQRLLALLVADPPVPTPRSAPGSAEIVGSAGIRLQRISLRQATTDLLLPRQPEAPRKPPMLGRTHEAADAFAAIRVAGRIPFRLRIRQDDAAAEHRGGRGRTRSNPNCLYLRASGDRIGDLPYPPGPLAARAASPPARQARHQPHTSCHRPKPGGTSSHIGAPTVINQAKTRHFKLCSAARSAAIAAVPEATLSCVTTQPRGCEGAFTTRMPATTRAKGAWGDAR